MSSDAGRDAIRPGLGNILTTENDVRFVWELIQQYLAGNVPRSRGNRWCAVQGSKSSK